MTYRTVQVANESSSRKMTALVTGGNGALGGETVRSLLRNGSYDVQSLDILLPEDEYRNEQVSMYIQADITNLDDLRLAFSNVDVVFHCASLTPVSIRHADEDYHQVNVVGTQNVIKACFECGVKRLLYTSSASVTVSRDPKEISCDSDESCPLPDDPLNIYVATKGKADQLIREANGKNGLKTCVLRPNVFVHSLFSAIEEILYFPSGLDFEISLVAVESVAHAHILAEKKLMDSAGSSTIAGKAFNVSDQKVSLLDFARFVASEKKTSLTYIPLSLVKFLAWINIIVYKWTGMIAINESLSTTSVQYKSHTYSSSLARQELGWGPSSPWQEVVKTLLKKKAEKGDKKEN